MSSVDVDYISPLSVIDSSFQTFSSKALVESETKAKQNIEKMRIVDLVKNCLKYSVLLNYSEEQKPTIEKHWEKVLEQACFNAGEDQKNSSTFLSIAKVSKIYKELQSVIYAIEPKGISLHYNHDTEQGENIANIVRFIHYDIPLDKNIATWNNFKMVFLSEGHDNIVSFRNELQKSLLTIQDLALEEKHSDKIVNMLIGQDLSYFTYTNPPDGHIVRIPQKINGKWQLSSLKVKKIPLTPSWCPERIYAIALEKTRFSPDAIPCILFRGTPHLAAEGFNWAIIADFTPGKSVGEILYDYGKEELKAWVEKNYSEKSSPIQVYGQSLGGSLSYLLAEDFPNEIEVNAYVAAGLLGKNLKEPVQGQMFFHENDIVQLEGKHPEGLNLIKVITNSPRNAGLAHMRAYGTEESILLKVNQSNENKRFIRTFLTKLKEIVAIPVFLLHFLFLTLRTIQYQITKLLFFKQNQKTEKENTLPL